MIKLIILLLTLLPVLSYSQVTSINVDTSIHQVIIYNNGTLIENNGGTVNINNNRIKQVTESKVQNENKNIMNNYVPEKEIGCICEDNDTDTEDKSQKKESNDTEVIELILSAIGALISGLVLDKYEGMLPKNLRIALILSIAASLTTFIVIAITHW